MKQHSINENLSVARVSDIVSAEMDGEVLMMRIKSGMYYGLNDVGSRIWELITEPQQVSRVIDCLMAEYDVERTQCQVDTLDLLKHFYEEGLIMICD